MVIRALGVFFLILFLLLRFGLSKDFILIMSFLITVLSSSTPLLTYVPFILYLLTLISFSNLDPITVSFGSMPPLINSSFSLNPSYLTLIFPMTSHIFSTSSLKSLIIYWFSSLYLANSFWIIDLTYSSFWL